jgi:hypothetical protein
VSYLVISSSIVALKTRTAGSTSQVMKECGWGCEPPFSPFTYETLDPTEGFMSCLLKILVESGFCLECSLTLAAVKSRERLSLNSSLWLLNAAKLCGQMLFEYKLICKISIAVIAMELTDTSHRL